MKQLWAKGFLFIDRRVTCAKCVNLYKDVGDLIFLGVLALFMGIIWSKVSVYKTRLLFFSFLFNWIRNDKF